MRLQIMNLKRTTNSRVMTYFPTQHSPAAKTLRCQTCALGFLSHLLLLFVGDKQNLSEEKKVEDASESVTLAEASPCRRKRGIIKDENEKESWNIYASFEVIISFIF